MEDKDKKKKGKPDLNELAHRIVKEATKDKNDKREQTSQKE